jgi:hypothetical protein
MVVGPFANIVALPCDCRGEPTFRNMLRGARETIGAAVELDDLPFETLVERLDGRALPGARPLIQATIGVESEPPAIPSFGELRVRRIALASRGAKFDFSVEARVEDGAVVIDFGYSLDLFDDATAVRMADGLVGLIEEATTAPDARIADLPESAALAACRRAARAAPASKAPAWQGLDADDDGGTFSPREAVIVAAMEAVLGVNGIGRNDNFFAVGGHSLLALQLVERLREREQLDLPLKEVLLGRSVAKLAELAEPIDPTAPPCAATREIEELSDGELDQMLADLQQRFANG